jgi:hypothetical protein
MLVKATGLSLREFGDGGGMDEGALVPKRNKPSLPSSKGGRLRTREYNKNSTYQNMNSTYLISSSSFTLSKPLKKYELDSTTSYMCTAEKIDILSRVHMREG